MARSRQSPTVTGHGRFAVMIARNDGHCVLITSDEPLPSVEEMMEMVQSRLAPFRPYAVPRGVNEVERYALTYITDDPDVVLEHDWKRV